MSKTTELTTEAITPIAYCQSMAMAVETMVEWLLKQQQQLSQQQRLLQEREREIEKQLQEIEQLKDSLDKLKNRSSKK